jgi:hypothetical protein
LLEHFLGFTPKTNGLSCRVKKYRDDIFVYICCQAGQDEWEKLLEKGLVKPVEIVTAVEESEDFLWLIELDETELTDLNITIKSVEFVNL